MATKFGGRNYKKTRKEEPEAPAKKKTFAKRPERPEREAPERGRGGYDREQSGRGRDKGGEDSDFIHVTGLFPSKKGNSFTVFIKGEMLDKLADLQEDDLLGVSESKFGMSLWIKKGDK